MGRLFDRCKDKRFNYVGIPFKLPHQPKSSGPWYKVILGADYVAQINNATHAAGERRRGEMESARRKAAANPKPVRPPDTPAPNVESCGQDDVDCTMRARCAAHIAPQATKATKAKYPSCLNQNLQRELKVRQKTLAADFEVDGELVRLYLGRHPWTKGTPGDWFGEILWGRLEYPQGYNVVPALAKTTIAILNKTLTKRCAKAREVDIYLTTFSTKFSNKTLLTRTGYGRENYLQAFRDGDIWHFTLHDDYVQALEAKARLGALWSMISSPNALGYWRGTIQANDAAAQSAQARLAVYAREGKVCKMPKQVRHCHVSTTWTVGYGGSIGGVRLTTHTPTRHSSCPKPCEFAEGYCDMSSGKVFKTAENAERSNCRSATQDQIDAAIERVQPASQVKTYNYNVLYTPWHELPHSWKDGLKF